jgi:pimeloyl-ACP methyl ester carboxylesterase
VVDRAGPADPGEGEVSMPTGVAKEPRTPSGSAFLLNGVTLDVLDRGSGRPVLLLHPEIGLDAGLPVLDFLTREARVIAPSHPGFGRSPVAASITTVDDLAYLYLDLLKAMDLRDVCLVGISLGGWIAAEIAIKSTDRVSSAVFANPVGIKVGPRDHRDIADIFALRDEDFVKLAYSDPSIAIADYSGLPDETILHIARSRDATARYCWSPYMHDPKLKSRMHRIDVPALVLWGEDDGLAPASYGAAFADLIPGARFQAIPKAGRFPHIEQPARFAEQVLSMPTR